MAIDRAQVKDGEQMAIRTVKFLNRDRALENAAYYTQRRFDVLGATVDAGFPGLPSSTNKMDWKDGL